MFSVITPSFNQGAYIERTIDSVLSQGYPDLELIIIDGGSTDETVNVIKKYERHLTYWVSERDRGQCHAINKGMRRATGEFRTWLNSDDWYLPDTLRTMTEMFAADPAVGVVVGAGQIVDPKGRLLYHKEPTAEITTESLFRWLQGGDFMQPSSAFRASAWDAVGGLDEGIHIALDVDLWLRMAKAGIRFGTTNVMFSGALSHPGAKTTAFEDLMRLDCDIVVIQHGGAAAVRQRLENMVNQLSWYAKNYETLVNHPAIKLLRPWVKRLSREGNYWSASVPPWVKSP